MAPGQLARPKRADAKLVASNRGQTKMQRTGVNVFHQLCLEHRFGSVFTGGQTARARPGVRIVWAARKIGIPPPRVERLRTSAIRLHDIVLRPCSRSPRRKLCNTRDGYVALGAEEAARTSCTSCEMPPPGHEGSATNRSRGHR